jgi:DNA-directed RNA polymerase specialized sigma24 family protein
MLTDLEDRFVDLVRALEPQHAMSALHFASRLVRHRMELPPDVRRDRVWVAGITGEPTEQDRALGEDLVRSAERHVSRPAGEWDSDTAANVHNALSGAALRVAGAVWSEHDRDSARDYLSFCRAIPEATDDPATEWAALLDREGTTDMGEAIESLPESYRALLRLRLDEDLGYDQCAARLSVSPASARQMWWRTLRTLRKQIADSTDKAAE